MLRVPLDRTTFYGKPFVVNIFRLWDSFNFPLGFEFSGCGQQWRQTLDLTWRKPQCFCSPRHSYASWLGPPLPASGRTIRTWITCSPLLRYMTKFLIAPPAPAHGSLRRGNHSFTTQEKEVTTWCPSCDPCHALLLLFFCRINCWQRSRWRIDGRAGGSR